MIQGKNNCCPYCGADEEKMLSGCCKELQESIEFSEYHQLMESE